ncbi:ABC transporter B family member 6 [Rhizoctonia solani]|uniref:ABC transporter B family member 6 n=1 Tax=Rhizoctonia solani TaxID=456999 RepID=A0A0K6FSM4_9AGAM|nr:ABC transporter B family member 6 [Rhizoctonia solani]
MTENLDADAISDYGSTTTAREPTHPPSQEETIRDGTSPPADERSRTMDGRCDPCKARGQRSKCDRVWPSCSKCIREGTEDGCYGAIEPHDAQAQPNRRNQADPPRAVSAVPPPPPPAFPAPAPPARRATSAAPVLQQAGDHISGTARHDDAPQSARAPARTPRRSQSPPRAPPSIRESSRVRTPPAIRANQADPSLTQHIHAQAAHLREALAALEAQMTEIETQPGHPQPAGKYRLSSFPCTHAPPGIILSPPCRLRLSPPAAYGVPPCRLRLPLCRLRPFSLCRLRHHTHSCHPKHATHGPFHHAVSSIPLAFPTEAPQIAAPIFAGLGIEGRRAPAIIPGHIGGRTFAMIPDTIRKLYTGPHGCNTHVSLGYFTDDYREDISKHTSLTESMVFNPKTNRFEAASAELPDLGEGNMLSSTYIRAWQNKLGFFRSINHPDLHYWQAHYNLVTSQRDFFDNFPKWREYCITVRKRRLQQGIDPSILQRDILGPIEAEYERNKTLSAVSDMLAQAARSSTHVTPPATQTMNRIPRPSSSPSLRRLTQGQGPSAAHPTPSDTPSEHVCFFCGSSSHLSTSCSAKTLVNGKPLLAKPSESGSRQINGGAAGSTYAPCAGLSPTLPNNAPSDPRKIVTPLIPDRWEQAIQTAGIQDQFTDVPIGLRMGFRLGSFSPLSFTTIHKNHLSATKNASVVDNHICSELAAGRYSGPFSHQDLESRIGFFRASPLGVVDKPSAPGSFRVIQDLSFPILPDSDTCSVNSEIDPAQFTCLWGFFSDVVDIVLNLPPGSQAATFDVDAAYRRMPVHPDDQPHIVVHWDGLFYVDHCVPFGATSSNGIFGRCGDCILYIFKFHGICHIVKWVDDFCFFRTPATYDGSTPVFQLDEAFIYAIAENLGWPWKQAKTRPFHNIFMYLGFEWDIARQSVSIPMAKRAKFMTKINTWLASAKTSLKDTESLLGSLIHCAYAIPSGRSRISGLSRFTASFSHDYSRRFVTRSRTVRASEDVMWWRDQLSQPWCGSLLKPHPPTAPCEFFMDASTSFGIGVVCGQEFGMWQLAKGWSGSGRDIGWAEMVAVEIALDLAIHSGISNATIQFWSDNQGVIGALNAGRSRNDQQNIVLRRVYEKQLVHNIRLRISYVNTVNNIADGPSRGIPPPNSTPFKGPVTLDQDLQTFLLPTHPSIHDQWHYVDNGFAPPSDHVSCLRIASTNMSSDLQLILQTIRNLQDRLSALERKIDSLPKQPVQQAPQPPRGLMPLIDPSTDPLLHNTLKILPHALAKSTLSGYSSTIQRFIAFCTEQNIPIDRIFPSDETVLCAFATSFAHRETGGSLANALAALKTWHALHNLPWNGGPRLSYVVKAVTNCAPSVATRPERPGVTIDHLRDLHEHLDLLNPKDAAIYATACFAFWGMCRLGELLGSSRLKHDPSKLPSRSSMKQVPLSGLPLDVHLPSTKTSQRDGATIRLLPQNGRTDPIYAIINHLYVNGSARPSDYLFAYQATASEPARCVTKEEFLRRCNGIWASRGKERLSGHNFRIGGANHLIDREVPSDIVRALGRWKSGAYYKYWRKPEDKAVRFAQMLPDQPRAPGPRSRVSQGRLSPSARAA